MYTIRYDGKVGPASVKETAIVFANAEHGCIAKVTRNKGTAFLVYNSDQREALVLVEKPLFLISKGLRHRLRTP